LIGESAMMYALTKSLKNEIVKIAPGARVNCVAPGWTRTPMAAAALEDGENVYRALAT
jgi:NAD(P)-dependent dehydrogenase (short-subunit alcohol dehydrogenase family)